MDHTKIGAGFGIKGVESIFGPSPSFYSKRDHNWIHACLTDLIQKDYGQKANWPIQDLFRYYDVLHLRIEHIHKELLYRREL